MAVRCNTGRIKYAYYVSRKIRQNNTVLAHNINILIRNYLASCIIKHRMFKYFLFYQTSIDMQLKSEETLPKDKNLACLIGRAWVPGNPEGDFPNR